MSLVACSLLLQSENSMLLYVLLTIKLYRFSHYLGLPPAARAVCTLT